MTSDQPSGPFDARLTLLEDRSTPQDRWRVVSLVTAIRESLLREPDCVWGTADDSRLEALTRAADELTSRGIDADSLIRYGMLPEIVTGVVALVLPQWLFGDDVQATQGELERHWISVLAPVLGEPRTDAAEAVPHHELVGKIFDLASHVASWAMTASLRDIVLLNPRATSAAAAIEPIPVNLVVQYRWVVERFSVTRLADWLDQSLHSEYRWHTGGEVAPCPEELMRDRSISEEALAHEISRRATTTGRARELEAIPGVETSLAEKMQLKAAELLGKGQYSEAATLFEFARSQDSEDPRAANNLGFCLIPVDIHSALSHLTDAARMGYEPSAVNAYNRAFCFFVAGDTKSCLAIAEDYWDRDRIGQTGPATLWRKPGDEYELFFSDDVRTALAGLARSAAILAGDDTAERLWTTRAA